MIKRKKLGIREIKKKRKALVKKIFGRRKKNHYKGESVAQIAIYNVQRRCYSCGKAKEEYELTLSDDLIAKDICDDCLKFKTQVVKKAKKKNEEE